MPVVYDFAAARPSVAQLKANGAVAVCRYIKRWLPNQFDLTRPERDGYLGNGLGCYYNAEQAAGDFLTQSTGWWNDYGKYCADRIGSWGTPTDQGIAVAASHDTNVPNGQMAKIVGNYAAFRDGLGPYSVRAYAPISVIRELVREGIAPAGSRHWLPGAASWSGYSNWQAMWNALKTDPLVGIVQEVGTYGIPGTDRNQIVNLQSLGIHWPTGHPLAGSDANLTEDALTPELAARLDQIVAWEAERFQQVLAFVDQRINDLAGYTRDRVADSTAATTTAVSNVTAAPLVGAQVTLTGTIQGAQK